MGKLQTVLLTVIALLLAGQFVATAPGPFKSCEIGAVAGGEVGAAVGGGTHLVSGRLECRHSWLP